MICKSQSTQYFFISLASNYKCFHDALNKHKIDVNGVPSSVITCKPNENQLSEDIHTEKYFRGVNALNEKIPCLFASKNKLKPETVTLEFWNLEGITKNLKALHDLQK